MKVYLYLSCEGWVRFGPFEWLKLVDSERVIKDEMGKVVASFDGSHWSVPEAKYARYQFIDPFITTADQHPHPAHT
jgi:hypothetical protein